MRSNVIDEFNYCSSDNNRTNLYTKDNYTKEEIEKTREIRKSLLEFIKIVSEDENYRNELLESDTVYDRVTDLDAYYIIHYLENFGYISKGNYDRDLVQVYHYGDTFEEAFRSAIYEFVMNESQFFEAWNREDLNKDFSNRFKDGLVEEDDYYGPFFFAEHSLQLLRKYYGDNIPEDIIKEFEEYVKRFEKMDVIFSYETNRFEKKELGKILNRKRGE